VNASDLRKMTVGDLLDLLVGARAESERRSKLVPIKSAKVSYRAILDAEKAEELAVYRAGKAAFVHEDELDAWIMRSTTQVVTSVTAPPLDDAAAIIAMSSKRRATKAA
jgi:hypothetical protein